MKYKGLIFDLDGTLVNSIHALVYCTNLALARFGLGPLNEEQMMTIVGDGYKMQMRRSLLACGDEELLHYEEILPEVASNSSKMERRADEAERETDKLKKVEYMEERIGEVFEGVISSITTWGIYVELPNTIEGMIHVSMLSGDYFYYDESTYEMVGQATGKRYKLGEKVKVKVRSTDKMSRTIDFIISEDNETEEEKG